MTRWRELNMRLDHTCKYAVVALTFSVSVWFTPPDASSVVVPVVVSMSVATALLGKLLKRAINQSRPAGAKKLDSGMPSSHAVSLAYLSTAGALSLFLRHQRLQEDTAAATVPPAMPWDLVGALAMLLAASYYSFLRVYVGHHTVAQVLVGYAFGAACASAVMGLIYQGRDSGNRVDDLPLWARQMVLLASVSGCTFCMIRFGRKWIREDFSFQKNRTS